MGSITIDGATYAKEATFNLVSILMLLDKGWHLNGNSEKLWLTKEGSTINFDIKVKTKKSMLFCIRIKRQTQEVGALMTSNIKLSIIRFMECSDMVAKNGIEQLQSI